MAKTKTAAASRRTTAKKSKLAVRKKPAKKPAKKAAKKPAAKKTARKTKTATKKRPVAKKKRK